MKSTPMNSRVRMSFSVIIGSVAANLPTLKCISLLDWYFTYFLCWISSVF